MYPLNVLREKYFPLYQQMAIACQQQSPALRLQVGCVLVLPSGLITCGWNGMPSGLPNQCEQVSETGLLVTDDRVIHAEANALDKLARQGISATGALVFVTTAPCIRCAVRLQAAGVQAVHYQTTYWDQGLGVQHLNQTGIPCLPWQSLPPASVSDSPLL